MRPDLLELASKLAERGDAFALVTVVRREPPSSARVGDQALVIASGEVRGWVGGGCTRATLLRESRRAIAAGEPRLVSISPDPAAEPRAGVVALPMTCMSGGTVDLYIEPVLPTPSAVVFGATPPAASFVRIARAMGYRVTVIDPEAQSGDFPEATRVLAAASEDAVPPDACVLVAMMDERDVEVIERVVQFKPAYLGVIASRKRFGEMREALLARGVPLELLDRIAAPAGLDIGARTPDEMALSVMAQIVERRRRAAPVRTEVPTAEPRKAAIDPVCGMSVEVANARAVAEVAGLEYYFCCGGCRAKFIADPDRYKSSEEKISST